MSFELRRLSAICYVSILCITFEPLCLLSVNAHVFKVYGGFAEKTLCAKCCAVWAHIAQLNALTDKQIPIVNCIKMLCSINTVSLPCLWIFNAGTSEKLGGIKLVSMLVEINQWGAPNQRQSMPVNGLSWLNKQSKREDGGMRAMRGYMFD